MKNVLEIIVGRNGTFICCGDLQTAPQTLTGSLGKEVAAFCAEHGISGVDVVFYLGEETLFFKKIHLPAQTADVREAVELQRDLLLPFADDCLYSFTSERGKDGYDVLIYATARSALEEAVIDVKNAGFRLLGIFPESQRYISSELKKMAGWGLLVGRQPAKLLCFAGDKLRNRLLCQGEPTLAEAMELCSTETVFAVNPEEGSAFPPAEPQVMSGSGRFNLLPASYLRPDFFRMALVGLVILNIVALVVVGGWKIYQVREIGRQLDRELTDIKPLIKETEQLRIKEKKLSKTVERIGNLGQNFDLITFLAKLTKMLPENSYLDQIRLDSKTGAINIQGYTEDIAGLTKEIQKLGDTKLKSTRRRKNKTYFHIEIGQ